MDQWAHTGARNGIHHRSRREGDLPTTAWVQRSIGGPRYVYREEAMGVRWCVCLHFCKSLPGVKTQLWEFVLVDVVVNAEWKSGDIYDLIWGFIFGYESFRRNEIALSRFNFCNHYQPSFTLNNRRCLTGVTHCVSNQ